MTSSDLRIAGRVVVVPSRIEAEIVDDALGKAAAESRFREAVSKGMPPSEAYERYGVL